MKFREVAHLLIGCKVQINDSSITQGLFVTMLGIEWNSERPILGADGYYYNYNEVKPLLYPLLAMTEEQRVFHSSQQARWAVTPAHRHLTCVGETPESFKYLLDNHFDIFNLIPQGEAIDVTTLPKDPYKEEKK